MAILLTGGTGYTAIQLAPLLAKAGIPFVLTSRKGQAGTPPGTKAVKFDFGDPSTFEAPFEHKFSNDEKITAALIVPPQAADPAAAMNAFIEHATKKHGVKRFVLVTGSTAEKDQPFGVGPTWKLLDDMKLEYSVLRASWFMENFSQGWWGNTIKRQDRFSTACEDAKVPFISAKDIAAVAFWCLTTKLPLESSYRILGPELLTFDQVAEKISKHLGRKVEHVRVSSEEVVKVYMAAYFPEGAARFMSFLEATTAKGGEAALKSDAIEKTTGKTGLTFDDWMKEAAWQ